MRGLVYWAAWFRVGVSEAQPGFIFELIIKFPGVNPGPRDDYLSLYHRTADLIDGLLILLDILLLLLESRNDFTWILGMRNILVGGLLNAGEIFANSKPASSAAVHLISANYADPFAYS